MTRVPILFHFLLLVLLSAARPCAQTPSYAVGSQDVLTISVWGQPDLSGRFTVEADGTFTFPLIGRVRAGGSSLRDVESSLRRLLAEQGFLKNPQISVTVDQYRSQRIFVVGEVRTPGTYPLSGEMTLIEALARAGSTTERARDEAIIVHHAPGVEPTEALFPGQAGASDVIRVDLKQLQVTATSGNVLLRDGDTVFVPRAESMFVFGQVKNPGSYTIRGDTTVLQALSLAGGLTERGATNRVRIIRMVDGKKDERKVKLDELVRPSDTVVVGERFF